ncbi:MAG: hypothetical protein WBI08_06580 [Bacteroidales bacterium]
MLYFKCFILLIKFINFDTVFISSSSLFPISPCVSLFNGIDISKITEFFKTKSISFRMLLNTDFSSSEA